MGEFEDISSSSSSRSIDIEVVEGNVAVIVCPGIPASRPAAVVEFLHNGVKITQSGQSDIS